MAIDEFQFGLHKRVYNYNMKIAREAKGLTMRQLAEKAACDLNTLYLIQAFKQYPKEELKQRIAIVLEVPIDIIFPEDIKGLRIHSRKTIDDCTITLSEVKEIGSILDRDSILQEWEDDVIARVDAQKYLPDTINKIVSTLTEREQSVIRMRYGLDGTNPMRLEEIGKLFGKSRNRISQIEQKALRKMRHPTSSKILKEFVK